DAIVVLLGLRPDPHVEDYPYRVRGDLALAELADGVVERVVDRVVDSPRFLLDRSFIPQVFGEPNALTLCFPRGGFGLQLISVALEVPDSPRRRIGGPEPAAPRRVLEVSAGVGRARDDELPRRLYQQPTIRHPRAVVLPGQERLDVFDLAPAHSR